ncbi:hypothetical protein [Foetidibacter luteolus]|uniref:hypothetical protein n=1 Tax=Foetidibacter luteolus TaxID=2608880 RepID=UPI00129BD8F7|nr:hypothetical protein [Foetidibacter luteolus]
MKKLLLVLAVAAFASCGGGESTETATDSTVTPVDTTPAPVTVDTTAVKDSTVADTTKK